MTSPTLTTWSYTRLSAYEQCPLRAKLLYLDKRTEEKGPPLLKGIAVHEACEAWLKEGTPLPDAMKWFQPQAKVLQKKKAQAEKKWALTRAWEPAPWFGPETWCRIVVDVVVPKPYRVIDYKTGRKRDSHRDQMRLYALAALCMEPEAPEVDVELWYLDDGDVTRDTYRRGDVDLLQRSFAARVVPYEADTLFAPTPGPACRWCSFGASKGGPCEFG